MEQGTQGHGVGVALPDDIDVAGREIDGRAAEDFAGDVVEHAIAAVDRVVEPEQQRLGAVACRLPLDGAFAAHAAVGVFAGRGEGIVLGRPTGGYGDEGIYTAGREGDEAAVPERCGDLRGEQGIYGPGTGRRAGGAELVARHHDDVLGLGQGLHCYRIEEVGLDRLDPLRLELLYQRAVGEARDGKDLP